MVRSVLIANRGEFEDTEGKKVAVPQNKHDNIPL
jgi:hypothetical protein